jgi:hypothetical protein
MAKKQKAIRGKFADEKYLGQEPDLRGEVSDAQIIQAYNWYNYFYDADQAKAWIIEYLKEFYKTEKELIKNANRIDSNNCRTSGWTCRILLLGGDLPQELQDRNIARIKALAARNKDGDEGIGHAGSEVKASEEASEEAAVKEQPKQVISIQERIVNRANDLIADIEVQLDNYYRDGTMFKPSEWMSKHEVKPAIAQRIADYYKPLYSEVFDAYNGKDEQLREAYASWRKPKLRLYVEFVKSIIAAAETRATIVKASRKPRKKKEKSPVQLVSKLKYKVKDDEYKFVSIDPKQIIGSNQLWIFNTKYRTLAVYNAMGPAGLNVKGSTLTGFDEKTSIVKKLRKPTEQVNKLLDGGKVVLRKFMDDIKCKPKGANGRINNETILLRVIK